MERRNPGVRLTPCSFRAFTVAFSTLALLGGCALFHRPSAPVEPVIRPKAEPHPSQNVVIKPKKAPPHGTAEEDDPADAVRTASIDPRSLLGQDPDAVRKKLGPPAHRESGPLSQEWVYAAPGCSFRIFFYPKVNSSSFRALKYGGVRDTGETIDASDACVRKILTVRLDAIQ
jgi:hypothetical protein